MDRSSIVPQPAPKPKKRQPQPDSWKENRIKAAKLTGVQHLGYKGEMVPAKVHRPDEDCSCHPKCRTKFTPAEKENAFNSYYACGSNNEKILYLRSLISKLGRKNKFFLKVSGQLVPICLKYFLATFDIKYSKLERKVLNWSTAATDLRGRHSSRRTTTIDVKNQVRQYFMDLEPRESHYSRSSNPHRTFLDSDITVAKLYRNFIAENPNLSPFSVMTEAEAQNTLQIQRVSLKMFRKIFNYEFNIGIGIPRSDICETCERNHILQKTADPARLLELKTEHDEHLREAEGFYAAMKSEALAHLPATTACLNFDFEKNMPLPVTNTAGEFYTRQLWVINFGVHNLRTGHCTMFLYSETFAQKGVNEVLSCLSFYISNIVPATVRELLRFSVITAQDKIRTDS